MMPAVVPALVVPAFVVPALMVPGHVLVPVLFEAAMEMMVVPLAADVHRVPALDHDGGAQRGCGTRLRGAQGRDPEQDRDRHSCRSHRSSPSLPNRTPTFAERA
jgi:hypothetical protein